MKSLVCVALMMLALTKAASQEMRQKPSGSKQEPPEEMLTGLERQTWALIKRRDLKAYAHLMADGYYEIFPGGDVYTKEQVIKFFENEFVLKGYSLGGFHVVMLNKEAGLVVYKADVQGVNKGKDETYSVASVSGWAKRGGEWLNVF